MKRIINSFNVLRLAAHLYMRETLLVITAVSIKRDSRGESKEIHGLTEKMEKMDERFRNMGRWLALAGSDYCYRDLVCFLKYSRNSLGESTTAP